MATQTIEIEAPESAVTMRIFPVGSNTQTSTDKAVTIGANGRGTAQYTDAPAGDYVVNLYNAAGRLLLTDNLTLTLETATFRSSAAPSESVIAQAVWDLATNSVASAGSIGKRLLDFVTNLVYSTAPTVEEISQAVVDAFGASPTITIVSPIIVNDANGRPVTITIVQGADYLDAIGTAMEMTINGSYPSWAGCTAYLDVSCGVESRSIQGSVVTATGTARELRFEMDKSVTELFTDESIEDIPHDLGHFDIRIIHPEEGSETEFPINRGKFISRRRSI